MSEPTNEPPLVTRPEPEIAPAPARSPSPWRRAWRWYRPFGAAKAWCALFVAAQLCGAVVAVLVVLGAYALAAPDPGQFLTDQMNGFVSAVDANAGGERPPVPLAFGQALAWGMLAAQLVSLGLILLVLPRRIGPDWKRQIGVRRPHPLHLFLVLLLVPGFMIGADFIQTLFLWATDVKPPAAVKALNGVFGLFPWPLTVLAVAVGPAVVEELWCRGFVGRGLCARYGILVGVLFTSGLFSLMHGDPSQLVVIACMGVYLHFVYLTTRCIWVPILLHATNNGLAIFLALVVKMGDADGEVRIPLVVHLLTLSLLAFGSVALWTSRAELEPVRGAEGAPWEPESPGVSAPPEGANAKLVYAAVSPAALMFTFLSFGALLVLAYQFSR